MWFDTQNIENTHTTVKNTTFSNGSVTLYATYVRQKQENLWVQSSWNLTETDCFFTNYEATVTKKPTVSPNR